MASRGAEDSVFKAAANSLKLWLSRASDAVLASWKEMKAPPNPTAIYATVPLWQAQVDKIMAALTPALQEGWAAAHMPYDFNINDPYVQANLAVTHNLLVGIPDEVHAKIIKEILEGTNAGETVDQIAARVEDVLSYTGSENWEGRARLIAQTETTRHFGSSMLAHGLLVQKQDKKSLQKRWITTMDGRERQAHELANEQTVPIDQPFVVDNELLMFPAAPNGSPNNVCNCRCYMRILEKAQ